MSTVEPSQLDLPFLTPLSVLVVVSSWFRLSSSRLHMLVGAVDWCASRLVRQICCQIILSDNLLSDKSRASVDLSLICHPSLSLIAFAFRSSEVIRLWLDLNSYGGTDSLGMFPIFPIADVLAPVLM